MTSQVPSCAGFGAEARTHVLQGQSGFANTSGADHNDFLQGKGRARRDPPSAGRARHVEEGSTGARGTGSGTEPRV